MSVWIKNYIWNRALDKPVCKVVVMKLMPAILRNVTNNIKVDMIFNQDADTICDGMDHAPKEGGDDSIDPETPKGDDDTSDKSAM